MFTKNLLILGLLLIFCCHQSHHHIFLFINTSPLTLASEEFIPHSEPATESVDGIPVNEKESVKENAEGSGSHSVKAENQPVPIPEQVIPEGEVNFLIVGNTPKESSAQPNQKDEPGDANIIKEKADDEDHSEKEKSEPVDAASAGSASESQVKPSSDSHSEKDAHSSDGAVGDSASANAENDLNKSQADLKGDWNDSDAAVSAEHTESNVGNDSTDQEVSRAKIVTPVVPAAPTPQKDEEPIPSFMEWTQLQQQKLHESNLAQQAVAAAASAAAHANGQNGHKSQHASHPQLNKSSVTGNQMNVEKARKEISTAKNFASPDCGAKVIQSNPESQNANGVLSSSHDEYMLNKCGIAIWFIVELCEPLKIEKVSLGNLELFSSSPKDIEIGISDRYPTREWTKLGPFTLPDIRAIHSINLPATNASTFGKFLKVNVLSHYGTEHFCPLSLVRVNGISEYEVLESENTHPEDIDAAEKEESALYEEPIIDQHQHSGDGKAADKSVFGSAKDVVINIVKKAAEVLVKSDKRKDSSNMANAAALSNCRSLLQCLPDYETEFHERILSYLSCNFSDLLPFLHKNSPWCGWDYCHALFSRHSIGLPWQPEGFYASLFGGPSVLHALCNYHKPLMKESCETLFAKNVTAATETGVVGEGFINESVKLTPTGSPTKTTEHEAKETVQVNEPPTETEKEGTLSKSEHPEGGKKQAEPEGHSRPSEEPAPASTEETTAQKMAPHISLQPPNTQQQQQQGTSEESPTASQGSQQQQVPSNQQQQQQQPPSPPTPPISVQQQQQQKESVFVRLSNRIKTLERNQTITASYLEELSRRFKKQNEENHHFNEGTKSFVNESKLKFKLLEDAYKFELRSLRRNTEEIRERLFNVQLQRSLLILLCLLQFVAILSVCVWIRRKFRYFESQMNNVGEQAPPNLTQPSVPVPTPPTSQTSKASSRQDSPQHPSVLALRKRVNSDGSLGSSLNSIDKSKKIKKKKKKLPDLKPVSLKSSGPASAPIELSGTGGSSGNSESSFMFKYPAPTSNESTSPELPISLKENVRPRDLGSGSSSPLYGNPPRPPGTPPGSSHGATLLSTQVDSPFTMISSTSTNVFVDSTVSTSSRFALLASPGPGATTKASSLKRSGSLTSLDSSSTSSYTYSVKTGSNSVMNGHGDSQSQGSTGSGKKRKNKFKALMPKIFDR